MDLLYALDDRFQSGVVEPAAIAPDRPAARRRHDVGDRRHRLRPLPDAAARARPRPVRRRHGRARRSGRLRRPGGRTSRTSRWSTSSRCPTRAIGRADPAGRAGPVQDPVPIVRAKDDVVVVGGQRRRGGRRRRRRPPRRQRAGPLLRHRSTADAGGATAAGGHVIVTDTNRDRAHHWRSSQDVVGFTEDDDPLTADVLRPDPADERLAVFEAPDTATTVAVQEGPVRARASAYGEPFAYRPEDRAVMAVDGDPTRRGGSPTGPTAERRIDPPRHRRAGRPRDPAPAGRRRRRPAPRRRDDRGRRAGADGGHPRRAVARPDGQRIDLEPTAGPTTLTITIDSVVVPDPSTSARRSPPSGSPRSTSGWPRRRRSSSPTDGRRRRRRRPARTSSPASAPGRAIAGAPIPEPTIVRRFEVPAATELAAEVTVRLDQRAGDAVLADLLGIAGPEASARLTGVAGAAGWAAADGDRRRRGSRRSRGASGRRCVLRRCADRSDRAHPAGRRLLPDHRCGSRRRGGRRRRRAAARRRRDEHRRAARKRCDGTIDLEITAIEPAVVLDRRYAEPVVLPAAIAELSWRDDGGPGAARHRVPRRPRRARRAAGPDPGHRPRRRAGRWGRVTAEPCGPELVALDAGTHELAAAPGRGLQVDRIVLADPSADAGGRETPAADRHRRVPGPPRSHRPRRRLPRRVLARGRRGLPRVVVGAGRRRRRSRTAPARRRRLQRLVDRAVGRPDGGRGALDRAASGDDRPRARRWSRCSPASPSPSPTAAAPTCRHHRRPGGRVSDRPSRGEPGSSPRRRGCSARPC